MSSDEEELLKKNDPLHPEWLEQSLLKPIWSEVLREAKRGELANYQMMAGNALLEDSDSEQVVIDWLTAALEKEGYPIERPTQEQRVQYAVHYVNVLSKWETTTIAAQKALGQLKAFHQSINTPDSQEAPRKRRSSIEEDGDFLSLPPRPYASVRMTRARSRPSLPIISPPFSTERSPPVSTPASRRVSMGGQKRKRSGVKPSPLRILSASPDLPLADHPPATPITPVPASYASSGSESPPLPAPKRRSRGTRRRVNSEEEDEWLNTPHKRMTPQTAVTTEAPARSAPPQALPIDATGPPGQVATLEGSPHDSKVLQRPSRRKSTVPTALSRKKEAKAIRRGGKDAYQASKQNASPRGRLPRRRVPKPSYVNPYIGMKFEMQMLQAKVVRKRKAAREAEAAKQIPGDAVTEVDIVEAAELPLRQCPPWVAPNPRPGSPGPSDIESEDEPLAANFPLQYHTDDAPWPTTDPEIKSSSSAEEVEAPKDLQEVQVDPEASNFLGVPPNPYSESLKSPDLESEDETLVYRPSSRSTEEGAPAQEPSACPTPTILVSEPTDIPSTSPAPPRQRRREDEIDGPSVALVSEDEVPLANIVSATTSSIPPSGLLRKTKKRQAAGKVAPVKAKRAGCEPTAPERPDLESEDETLVYSGSSRPSRGGLLVPEPSVRPIPAIPVSESTDVPSNPHTPSRKRRREDRLGAHSATSGSEVDVPLARVVDAPAIAIPSDGLLGKSKKKHVAEKTAPIKTYRKLMSRTEDNGPKKKRLQSLGRSDPSSNNLHVPAQPTTPSLLSIPKSNRTISLPSQSVRTSVGREDLLATLGTSTGLTRKKPRIDTYRTRFMSITYIPETVPADVADQSSGNEISEASAMISDLQGPSIQGPMPIALEGVPPSPPPTPVLPAAIPKPPEVTGSMPIEHLVPQHMASVAYPRPLVPDACPVWAMSRQEICEGTAYFRSYQAGVYICKGLARGYLLDGFGAPRDICALGGRFIISHVGGKSHYVVRTGETGEHTRNTELKQDQTETQASARSLYNNWRLKKPLVVIAGKNYALFPYDLGDRTYVVLGWYMVTHFWSELEIMPDGTGCKRIKIAMQWIPSQGHPWFATGVPDNKEAPSPSSPPVPGVSEKSVSPPAEGDKPMSRRKRLMTTPTCTARIISSTICSGIDPRSSSLASTSDEPIAPCVACGRHSPQVYEAFWVCLNGSCLRFWTLPAGGYPDIHTTRYASSFMRENAPQIVEATVPYDISAGPQPHPKAYDGSVTARAFTKALHCPSCGRISSRKSIVGWRCANNVCSLDRPILRTDVALEKAPTQAQLYRALEVSSELCSVFRTFQEPEGGIGMMYILPDDCGVIYHLQCSSATRAAADKLLAQYQELEEFERHRLLTSPMSTPMLNQHFAINSGMPYHYSSESETISLDKSPACVLQALDLINKKAALVHDPQYTTMAFNEALSICYLEGMKMQYHSDAERGLGDVVASLSLGSPAIMDFRPYACSTSHGKRQLRLDLRHGDIVVMEGRRIQEKYQHKVVPQGFRIGITVRQIYPDHIKSQNSKTRLSSTISRTEEEDLGLRTLFDDLAPGHV